MCISKPPSQLVVLPSFTLESGITLLKVPVAYTSYGALSYTNDNVIIVCHGFSADVQVHEWWSDLLGPGKALDTSRYFVICLNALGSPFGSASPLTNIDGDPRKGPYGPHFPPTTIRDDVRIHRLVLDTLGVVSVQCVIGGSMGGMLAVEWAFMGEHYIKSFVSIAATSRQGAWAISWNEVEREIIQADPKYKAGRYSLSDPPHQGLSAARMAGLLTYRSPVSYENRFGRTTIAENIHKKIDSVTATPSRGSREESTIIPNTENPFLVQSYLRYKAQKFCQQFDANCYISLTRKLDSHDVTRGRVHASSKDPVRDALHHLRQPALVVGISSDLLYPWTEQEQIAMGVNRAHGILLVSGEGHDAFLIHVQDLNMMIAEFLQSTDLEERFQGRYDHTMGDQTERLPEKVARKNLSGAIECI